MFTSSPSIEKFPVTTITSRERIDFVGAFLELGGEIDVAEVVLLIWSTWVRKITAILNIANYFPIL